MRVLCLVDGVVAPGERWMWTHLSGEAELDQVECLGMTSRDQFPRWGKLLAYYPSYVRLAHRAIRQCHRTEYDVIVAWEAKTGFPLAMLRRLTGTHRPRLVVLAFAYKGIALHAVGLGRWFMHGIDHITVPTRGEVTYYSQLLQYPRERVSFVPLGGWEVTNLTSHFASAESLFIFAGGRTDRDYATLFSAMRGLPVRLIVNVRRFNVQGLAYPENVIINEFMPARDYHALIASAQFIVVPLQDNRHAAGLVSILQAMSAGKAIIATRTCSTVDYVEDGVTGLLVPPGDSQAMRSAITDLLAQPERAQAMGRAAQQCYYQHYTSKSLAERTYAVVQKLVALQPSKAC